MVVEITNGSWADALSDFSFLHYVGAKLIDRTQKSTVINSRADKNKYYVMHMQFLCEGENLKSNQDFNRNFDAK